MASKSTEYEISIQVATVYVCHSSHSVKTSLDKGKEGKVRIKRQDDVREAGDR